MTNPVDELNEDSRTEHSVLLNEANIDLIRMAVHSYIRRLREHKDENISELIPLVINQCQDVLNRMNVVDRKVPAMYIHEA